MAITSYSPFQCFQQLPSRCRRTCCWISNAEKYGQHGYCEKLHAHELNSVDNMDILKERRNIGNCGQFGVCGYHEQCLYQRFHDKCLDSMVIINKGNIYKIDSAEQNNMT